MKLFRAYRKSQEAQRRWIRQHPVQYVALNATLLAVFIWIIERKDRKWQREFEAEYAKTQQNQ